MDEFVDRVLSRLQRHFTSVSRAPPASEETLAGLRDTVPRAPEELQSLYRACDGFDLGLCEALATEGVFLSTADLRECYPVYAGSPILKRLIPIRSDGCGNFDCLVAGVGPGEGAVVFWDHETCEGPAHLLAGSLGSYLLLLTDYLVHVFLPSGTENGDYVAPELDAPPWVGTPSKAHPWPFDEVWLRRQDARADHLLSDRGFRSMLLHQGE